jgi:hypothetical protein
VKIRAPIPNAIILFYDPGNENFMLAEWSSTKSYEATESCISVATLPDIDGETTIEILNANQTINDRNMVLAYEGPMETPTGKVSVSTSNTLDIIGVDVLSNSCLVQVWINRLMDPDHIIFVVQI